MLKSSEYSAIGYDVDEQAAVHDELREFLGSDDDESESDADTSEAEPVAAESRKRKRGTDSEDDETASLAHRVKPSRPSTLKQAVGQDDNEEAALAGSQDGEQAPVENPDDDEDELEREMLAAFEGDYDE
jgi:RNA polymerase II subunit A-like phosphatase